MGNKERVKHRGKYIGKDQMGMEKTLIFMSNGCEEVEALTVVDLLRRADIGITMVSLEEGLMVTGSHGIEMKADCMYSEADFDGSDMIILPGGLKGTQNLMEHEDLNKRIVEFNEKGKMLAAICAAPTVLAKDGILMDKSGTCYPGMADKMRPGVKEYKEDSVVVDKNVITSRGMGTAIDFSAAIIEHYKGSEAAKSMMETIVYK